MELRVVATAGHVDHGKSTLVAALTGMDPDRWAEEKRRGLTIDLGYAWCELPGGREIAFVDVPGHERFITNMLAGVGPAPAVLFVVAADEGWAAQSEEHLAILDALDVRGGVMALTKSDVVGTADRDAAIADVAGRLGGTTLAGAPIVPVSATAGEGIEELRAALDRMLEAVPVPEPSRTRLFVDRVFTIKGAGTVVTGTLAGGCLAVGDEVEIAPRGIRGRIRSLQTHRKTEDRACPVTRVAANLAGVDRDRVARGDVLIEPGTWQPTRVIDAELRAVRGLTHPIGARGAYKVYAGAAEADARIRFLAPGGRAEPGAPAFVRITTTAPLVLDAFDRIVVRDAGRRETVAGGRVLDAAPPRRAGRGRAGQLEARSAASRQDLPGLMAAERGAVPAEAALLATGAAPETAGPARTWLLRPGLADQVAADCVAFLEAHHRDHPLEEGAGMREARGAIASALRAAGAPTDPGLVDELLAGLAASGAVVVSSGTVRTTAHRVALDAAGEDLDRLVAAIGGEHERTPPTIKDLTGAGFAREVIDAAVRAGAVVKISPEMIVTPALAERAVQIAGAARDGITVSAFREALGTSRKYAVPMLEHLDRTGVTRREGDLRFPR